MRGQVKEWWGKLTDEELEQANGNARPAVRRASQFTDFVEEAQLILRNGWKAGMLYAAQSAGVNQGILSQRFQEYIKCGNSRI